jgi:hypothetical protein
MEIHKPKPWRGSAELLKEIGTIVIGVLIALGAEQAVEAWHWHNVVGEEREALRDEIGHLRAAMMGRLELEPCYVARLADVKEIIRRHDANQPLGIAAPMGRPLYPPTPRPIWELAVADQSLAHMKLSEKRRFIETYEWVSVYEGITENERNALRELQSLNHADKLTTADWSNIREAYEHAVESHGIIAGSAALWLAPFDALASETPKVSVRHTPPVEAFCAPMLATGNQS